VSTAAGAEALVREFCRVAKVPSVPEVRLYLAQELVPLWQATEWRAAAAQPPPFWAFAWPGSIALARYVLDTPEVVRGRRVLDFGSGSGLAAIAAILAGATDVVAMDVDPLATSAQLLNAALNGSVLRTETVDATTYGRADADVVLAGDVCYEREPAEAAVAWLRTQAAEGRTVLLADPGRHYAPSHGLQLLETYDVPVLRELESVDVKRTRLWRMR
jgi:predicted nicotinamide N-methyase